MDFVFRRIGLCAGRLADPPHKSAPTEQRPPMRGGAAAPLFFACGVIGGGRLGKLCIARHDLNYSGDFYYKFSFNSKMQIVNSFSKCKIFQSMIHSGC
jgi:hypothetical protein